MSIRSEVQKNRSITENKGTPPEFKPSFIERQELSPKDFLLEKEPRTSIERVVCLAYYLTHYRDTQQFKTAQITKLNTEAAQPKLSNPAAFINDAIRRGLIIPSVKGCKQLSAIGEQYVQSLPDREVASAKVRKLRLNRKKTATRRKKKKDVDQRKTDQI